MKRMNENEKEGDNEKSEYEKWMSDNEKERECDWKEIWIKNEESEWMDKED